MINKLVSCLVVLWMPGLLLPGLLLPGVLHGQGLDNVMCVMNPDVVAKAEYSAEHLNGTVYFCCGDCAAKFKEQPDEYIAAANFQLFATGQYIQRACPFSGAEVVDGNAAKIGEFEIGMCCGNCQARVNGAEDITGKVAMVFAKDRFERGFKRSQKHDVKLIHDLSKATCPLTGKAVAAEFAVEHLNGMVYFCCQSCVDSFVKEPARYAVVANKQLFVTGQYVQKACPFSGAAATEGHSVTIGDHEFGTCCVNCQAKVTDAADDAARDELIFNKEAFARGFTRKTQQDDR